MRMKHVFNLQNNESKHSHLMKKFDQMCQQNSSSVKDLAKLATQLNVERPDEDEIDSGGYWSSPEDNVSSSSRLSLENMCELPLWVQKNRLWKSIF